MNRYVETKDVSEEDIGPQIGDRAPEFFIDAPEGRLPLSALASRYRTVIVMSHDSYRYHPDPQAVVVHKMLPWKGNVDVAEYERLFESIEG